LIKQKIETVRQSLIQDFSINAEKDGDDSKEDLVIYLARTMKSCFERKLWSFGLAADGFGKGQYENMMLL
jgi:hypothetical protein